MGRDYELQPASEFLFERRLVARQCADRRPEISETRVHGSGAILVASGQLPYRLTRREEFVVPPDEAATLTITSDPYSCVAVLGSSGRDWAISFCAQGEGESEAEARARLQQLSLSAAGGRLALTAPGLYEGSHRRGDLVVEGPKDGGVVIHCTYTPVEVRDMAGPVRVAATHARASILDTTGQVDATAGVVDFAGSCGRVTLNAEAEINLKVTARRFEGTLLAWAQRCVRVLVPLGFETPIEAVVSRRADFVCRTEFVSNVKQKRQGELYIFTCGVSNGARSGPMLHLRSEEATVVIDVTPAKQ
jgi:hypothetical protein